MINIELGDQQLPRIKYEKDGNKRDFRVSHNTLFEFIQQNCFVDVGTSSYQVPVFETPALPEGTVKYMAMPDGSVVLFMEKKEFSHDVKYHSSTFNAVPFPNLLFAFKFQPRGEGKYVLTTKRVFAFKEHVYRDGIQLYKFPYSHVFEDGDMCFFLSTELKDLAQMTSYISNWYTATFSDHYYNSTGSRNLWATSLREIFTKTQGERFDYSKLVPHEFTAQDVVRGFVLPYSN